jgi:hypothetical protein
MVRSLQNTKWNNATNVQCWPKPTYLVMSAVKRVKSYFGFVGVAGENNNATRTGNDLHKGSDPIH